jgi:hypothetical protein
MRTFWKWIVLPAVLAVWVAAAPSADKKLELPLPEGTTVKLILLRQKSVQEELKLTADEVKKIDEFTNKEYAEARKALKLGQAERRKKFKALGDANRKFLKDTLKPKQLKRLDQIWMQCTALMQLRRPEIAEKLKLTKDQSAKIETLQKEARKELAKFLRAKITGKSDEKMATLRAETRKKVMAILTDKQKEIVKELVGEPFKGKIVLERPRKGGSDD